MNSYENTYEEREIAMKSVRIKLLIPMFFLQIIAIIGLFVSGIGMKNMQAESVKVSDDGIRSTIAIDELTIKMNGMMNMLFYHINMKDKDLQESEEVIAYDKEKILHYMDELGTLLQTEKHVEVYQQLEKLFPAFLDSFDKAFEYSKNPSIFIGSILGYIDLETWKKIDKAQLYQVEINNKAIDDKLI